MDGAGSWTMLTIPRPMGWQERWDTCILGCKWELGRAGAGKDSVLLRGCASSYCPGQHCFQRVKALGANRDRIVDIPLRKSLCEDRLGTKFLKGSLTQQARGSPLLTEVIIHVWTFPAVMGDWTNIAQALLVPTVTFGAKAFLKGADNSWPLQAFRFCNSPTRERRRGLCSRLYTMHLFTGISQNKRIKPTKLEETK